MAVPYHILVIHLTIFLSDLAWSQYATLGKKALQVTTLDIPSSSRCNITHTGEKNYYRYLTILDDNLYIGAMNCLIKVGTEHLEYKNSKSLTVSAKDQNVCSIQRPSDATFPECQNHIRAVMPSNTDSSQLFVCGTGAFNPQKYSLSMSSFETNSTRDASKECPYDPLDNVTSIYSASGNTGNQPTYYFGVFADFLRQSSVIFRPEIKDGNTVYPGLTPLSASVKWLNAAQFAGSFNVDSEQYGKQVFFFFREIAEEYIASKTKIYSRVAKVCKDDQGYTTPKKSWLSYQKARLNCSLPGYEPYYFDDIYDVYEVDGYYYALFYKQGADLSSSAICVYSRAEILRVFSGYFKDDDDETWKVLPPERDPSPRLDNCKLHETNPSLFAGVDKSVYQLIDKNVNPVNGEPIFYQHGVQFLKLVVDHDGGNASNIYIATDKGEIYKLFVWSNCAENRVIQHIVSVLSPLEKKEPIWSMRLHSNSLYLGTDYTVAQVDLYSTCSEYSKIDSCIHSLHCNWCKDDGLCKSKLQSCSSRIDYKTIYQDVTDCRNYDLAELIQKHIGGLYLNVSQTKLKAVKGLYITLDINYRLHRSGPVKWKYINGVSEEVMLEDIERYILSNDGSMIIKNVSQTDSRTFAAYDTVYGINKKVAEYNLEVIYSDDDMVNAWKQAFVDWSESYRSWRSCSRPYLDQCDGDL